MPAELGEQRRRERVAGLAAQVDDPHATAAAPRAARRARAARAAPSSPAAASRCRRPRRRPRARPAWPPPCVRRSAGRTPACTTASCSSSTQISPSRGTRREDGRARADDDRRLAGDDPLALVAPLRVGQRRVQDGDAVAEAGPEAAEGLRRQRDLGDEHDRAAARARAPPRRRAGRPRSCRCRSRRASRKWPPPSSSASTMPRDGRLLLPRSALGLRLAGERRAPVERRSPRRARSFGATSSSARAGVEP